MRGSDWCTKNVWSQLESAVVHNLDRDQQTQLLALLEEVESGLVPLAADVDTDGVGQI